MNALNAGGVIRVMVWVIHWVSHADAFLSPSVGTPRNRRSTMYFAVGGCTLPISVSIGNVTGRLVMSGLLRP